MYEIFDLSYPSFVKVCGKLSKDRCLMVGDNLETDNNVLTAAIETNDKVRKNRDWESMTGRAVV